MERNKSIIKTRGQKKKETIINAEKTGKLYFKIEWEEFLAQEFLEDDNVAIRLQ